MMARQLDHTPQTGVAPTRAISYSAEADRYYIVCQNALYPISYCPRCSTKLPGFVLDCKD
jgi:hypothetical protein